ncbi:MAG: hypothetical protein EPO08_07150 [Rhodospirillaceae bacterium]|nr:MAG: hypothetical protein EPO08_07150 [Rhodospirillaceae bacterium]
MLASAGVYAVPFAVTLGMTGLVRWVAGAERAGQFVGLALPLGFLVAWAVIVAPGWHAYDSLGRIGHVVFGAALAGFALDFWRPRRGFAIAILLAFVAGSSWAEANGGLWPQARPDAAVLLSLVVSAVLGAALAWRIDRLQDADVPTGAPGAAILVLLMMIALTFAAIAAVSTDAALQATGLLLALAIAGYLTWIWITGAPLPAAAVCPAAAGLFALAWALVARDAATIPGLALAGLILFADGTARRVPLPRARISGLLYPLILAGVALLPMVLAAAVTLGLRRGG